MCRELSLAYGECPASLREAQCSVSGEVDMMCSVLFDSGVLHHLHVNSYIVEKHRDQWGSTIRPYDAWVTLADQKAVV